MKQLLSLYLSIVCLVLCLYDAQAQDEFSVEAYAQFLEEHENLSTSGLLDLYPAGGFHPDAPISLTSAYYGDSIDDRFQLTGYEKELIDRNGFMVSERLSYQSFGDALLDIYRADLPVFVSTDAILHALHMSYDEILKSVETGLIVPRLRSILSDMHGQLPVLAERYASEPLMQNSLDDLDVYLTVSLRLLTEKGNTAFPWNEVHVDSLLGFIDEERPAKYLLFVTPTDSTAPRLMDFSQFTVRGHYTDSPSLSRYFRCMMWLGRTEFYLTAPKSFGTKVHDHDLQRQAVDAALMTLLMEESGGIEQWRAIDDAIRFLVGESDNVTPDNINELVGITGISDPSDLLNRATWKRFSKTLSDQSYSDQKILSQILFRDPSDPEPVQPASAFMLFGQRFIIDSYVFHNVVFDRVFRAPYEKRMLPSSLDVLFALGNNGAAQLLRTELNTYGYAPELASVRYLIDSYNADFWESTFYNRWLGSLRTLNPPSQDDRTKLPRFMRSGAWWQQKMNTQLAAWTQIRHDNLLYAKQSYSTGVITCSYPRSLVEPFPEFYRSIADLAASAGERFESMGEAFADRQTGANIVYYFSVLEETCRTLEEIARKQLAHQELSDKERHFLQSMMQEQTVGTGCGATTFYDGWYPALFYPLETQSDAVVAKDYVVADVHTSPTDKRGNPVGWVKHVGTGPINLGVVACEGPDGSAHAYVGPVMSYYEHTTVDFKRLTDELWVEMYDAPNSTRPAWTNVYLADKNGGNGGEYQSLILSVERDLSPSSEAGRTGLTAGPNSPNPFSDFTTIAFSLAPSLSGTRVVATIHDVTGAVVAQPIDRGLPSGSYVLRWDGTDNSGASLPAGTYFYRIAAGDRTVQGTMTLSR